MENLKTICEEVLEGYPDKVNNYKRGVKGVMGLFIGEVMKRTKNRADPFEATKIFESLLNLTK